MHRIAASALLAIALTACAAGPAAAPADPLAGEYIAAASESAVATAERLTRAFAARHPGMRWTVRDVGSGPALALVKSGDADAGFISRELTVDEARDAQAIGLGFIAQVLVVNAANPVAGLSRDQLRGIFAGAITDWSEVGGVPGPVLVVLRPASSPTRVALDPLLRAPGTSFRPDALMAQDADATLGIVSSSPRAIGMVSGFHLADPGVAARAIAVDGVMPSPATVASGAYPYRRPLTLVVRANTSLIRRGAEAFRDFVHGEEGQRILRELF